MEFAIHLNVLVAYGMSRVINFKNVWVVLSMHLQHSRTKINLKILFFWVHVFISNIIIKQVNYYHYVLLLTVYSNQ